MSKYLIVAGVAVAVVLIARQVRAAQANPYNPANWQYLPGYKPQSGLIT